MLVPVAVRRVANCYTSLSFTFYYHFSYFVGWFVISKVKRCFFCILDVWCCKCICCAGFGSLLFGNLIVYFLFADETYITAESRTLLFIILTVAGVAGVLLMLFFCQRPTSEATWVLLCTVLHSCACFRKLWCSQIAIMFRIEQSVCVCVCLVSWLTLNGMNFHRDLQCWFTSTLSRFCYLSCDLSKYVHF